MPAFFQNHLSDFARVLYINKLHFWLLIFIFLIQFSLWLSSNYYCYLRGFCKKYFYQKQFLFSKSPSTGHPSELTQKLLSFWYLTTKREKTNKKREKNIKKWKWIKKSGGLQTHKSHACAASEPPPQQRAIKCLHKCHSSSPSPAKFLQTTTTSVVLYYEDAALDQFQHQHRHYP